MERNNDIRPALRERPFYACVAGSCSYDTDIRVRLSERDKLLYRCVGRLLRVDRECAVRVLLYEDRYIDIHARRSENTHEVSVFCVCKTLQTSDRGIGYLLHILDDKCAAVVREGIPAKTVVLVEVSDHGSAQTKDIVVVRHIVGLLLSLRCVLRVVGHVLELSLLRGSACSCKLRSA